ncbi:MAG TPA: DUF3667 domain-containing protein [Gammaproteobacteria bacterium]|nr:DUF3667 domain-containing protein [Gammaproteobacteria bacterium]
MIDAVERPAVCASCGRPLEGRYCSSCGEQALDPGELTVWHFLTRTVVHELFNFDGKIWRTLGLLLFHPGFLALEYATGRRRPYVNPLRILLVTIIAYVLATQAGTGFTLNVGPLKLGMAPAPASPTRSIAATLEQVDRFGILGDMFEQRFGSFESASTEIRDRFNRALNGFATPLSFTTVLFVALTLYVLLHRRRPLLVEHAVFSMHYYSFVLSSLLLPLFTVRFGLTRGYAGVAVILLVNLWQLAYLAIAIRRFYFPAGSSRLLAWTASTTIAPVVFLLNPLYLTVIQFVGGAYAIWRL